LVELKALSFAFIFVLLFSALGFAEENAVSPSPSAGVEVPAKALPAMDATSSTAFAIVNHSTAPLGAAILVLLALGVVLDKFSKPK